MADKKHEHMMNKCLSLVHATRSWVINIAEKPGTGQIVRSLRLFLNKCTLNKCLSLVQPEVFSHAPFASISHRIIRKICVRISPVTAPPIWACQAIPGMKLIARFMASVNAMLRIPETE